MAFASWLLHLVALASIPLEVAALVTGSLTHPATSKKRPLYVSNGDAQPVRKRWSCGKAT